MSYVENSKYCTNPFLQEETVVDDLIGFWRHKPHGTITGCENTIIELKNVIYILF